MDEPILFGAAYSVYVRTARLALVEKRVPYRLVEVDVFAEGGPPATYRDRHPFGKIPAFEHAGFRLYETSAITRYVEDAFDGPRLMPDDARARARINQIISVLDNYGYRAFIWELYMERVNAPRNGKTADEAKIADCLPRVVTCLSALDGLADPEGPWLAGSAVSLADLYAAPMFVYLTMAAEARDLLPRQQRLERWWRAMRERPSMAATCSPLE